MTKQEIFNKVWERAKTKVRCVANGGCAYRKGKNASCIKPKTVCFVGALIPDELYNPIIEGVKPTDCYSSDKDTPIPIPKKLKRKKIIKTKTQHCMKIQWSELYIENGKSCCSSCKREAEMVLGIFGQPCWAHKVTKEV